MKKLLMIAIVVAVLASLIATPVLAKGKDGQSGKSNVGQLYLYEKNPAGWSIVEGGAWGKYNYKLSGDPTDISGVFNGHGLDAGVDYSLIYYPEPATDPWPAPPVVQLIGSGTANTGGNVHITGTATIGGPDTQPTVGDYIGQTGDKIWLVLSSDLDTTGGVTTMIGWTPAEYLFENNLINTP